MDYTLQGQVIERVINKVKYFIIPAESNGYKSIFLQSRILLYFVLILAFLKVCMVLLSFNLPVNIFFADITKSSLENFVNQTRIALGLNSLAESQKLNQVAQLKAQNMIQEQYFSHTSPSGITPWFWFSKAGYNYKYAGENLAIGFFESEEVYNAWLNSPSHKANIVNPKYTEVGTAVLPGYGGGNAIIVVQEFASPAPAKTATTKSNPIETVKKPVEQKPVQQPETQKEVLSEIDINKDYLVTANTNTNAGFSSRFLNYIIYDYQDMLQKGIYVIFTIIILAIISVIIHNYRYGLKHQFVFRSLLLVVVLLSATAFDQSIITSLIPHKVII